MSVDPIGDGEGKSVDEQTLPAGAAGTPEVRLEPGTTLGGRFEVTQCLGEGGSGGVYAARDRLLAEQVALKILHARFRAGADGLARLRAEVRAARRITHPNVCRVHDLVETGGLVFVVMELLVGETLRRRLRRPLVHAQALEIARLLGAGLSAAHRADVIHCDVKPENVILAAGGDEGVRVALTDFGIARMRGTGRKQGNGLIEGTPAYMAPEQLLGRALDERTDVYGLAAVVFELLTGAPPFGALAQGSVATLVDRILGDEPRPPDGAPALGALEAVLHRGLAKDPAARYDSVDAFVAGLVAGAGRGGLAARPGTAEVATPTPTPSRRRARPTGRTRGTRRIATVVHILIQEAGPADEVDEEAAIERIDALLAAAETTLADAGGVVVGRAPRSVVAVFGAASSSGEEPDRAADAARAMVGAGGQEVCVRAGIDTGRLLVRAPDRGPTSVAGDALASAEALALAAAPGEIRVSARTARHLARRFVLEPLAGSDAAGIRARRRGEGPGAGIPFIGRDAELDHVASELAQAPREKRPRSALVVGGAGLGKSRLRREVVDLLVSRAAFQVAAINAEPDDVMASHAVVRRLVRAVIGPAELTVEEAERIARATLHGHHDDELVGILAALLGDRAPAGVSAGLVLAAARALFAAVASERPLLLVVDDAHWTDDASLDLLEALAGREVEGPVALLVLGRSDLLERRQRWRRGFGVVVELAPLSPAHGVELARLHLGADGAAAHAVAEAADGNPFFVEELARDRLERRGDGAAPPSTVEQAIQARLDRLSPDEREVLRVGAVLGRTFRRGDLAAILEEESGMPDLAELDVCLTALEARRILFSLPQDAASDDRYAIKHALIRDVAYHELAPAARRALHAAAARVLRARRDRELAERQEQPGEDAAPLLVELARHLEGADQAAEAAAMYRRAGELAAGQDAHDEALKCYRRARELGAGDADLLTRLGASAQRAGSTTEAQEALDAAVALATGKDLVRALSARAFSHRVCSAYDAALADCRHALALAGELGLEAEDPALVARVYALEGFVDGYCLGNHAAGLAECKRAVSLLEGGPHQQDLAHAYLSLGAVLFRIGRHEEDIRCKQQSLAIGEKLGSLSLRARSHYTLGATLIGVGRFDEAAHHERAAIELFARSCDRVGMAVARNNLATALIEMPETDAAEHEAREAIRLGEQSGTSDFYSESMIVLGRAAARRADWDAALAHLDEAERVGSRIDAGITQRYKAAIASLRGEHDAALLALERALALLGDGDVVESARVLGERARVLLRRGDAQAAAAARDAAVAALAPLGARHDIDKLADPAWI